MFTDVSARLTKTMAALQCLDGRHRLRGRGSHPVLGSDFPIVTPDEGIQLLLGLNDSFNGVTLLPQQLLHDIVWKRPLSLLDL